MVLEGELGVWSVVGSGDSDEIGWGGGENISIDCVKSPAGGCY